MFFKFIGILFILGLFGFGSFTYVEYTKKSFMKQETMLKEELKIAKQKMFNTRDNTLEQESQLLVEYDTLKKKLEDEYMTREAMMKKRYGDLDKTRKRMKAQNIAAKKDIRQREKGLKRLSTKLLKKENKVKYKEKKANKKLSSLKNIKMECKIFDLRKIDEYIKDFQTVAYASRDKVNLFCGFDPSNRNLANRSLCLQGKKDREKARSLLSLIYSTAANVKQKYSYRKYVKTQRYRMQINAR